MALLDHWKSGTYQTPQKLCWPVSIIFSSLRPPPHHYFFFFLNRDRELDQHSTLCYFQTPVTPVPMCSSGMFKKEGSKVALSHPFTSHSCSQMQEHFVLNFLASFGRNKNVLTT